MRLCRSMCKTEDYVIDAGAKNMVCKSRYSKSLVMDFWLQCSENQPIKPTNQTNQSNQTDQSEESNQIDAEQKQNTILSDLEYRIIELLKTWPDATTKEITKKLEITDNQVKYYIKKLKDNGKIERVGTNRKGLWKVI